MESPWASEAPPTAQVSQANPSAVPECRDVPSARQGLFPVPTHEKKKNEEKKNEKLEKIIKGRDLRDKSFQIHILPTTSHVPHSSADLTLCLMSTGIFICLVPMPKRVHGT